MTLKTTLSMIIDDSNYEHLIENQFYKCTSLVLAGQLSIKGHMFNGIVSRKETLFHTIFCLLADRPTCQHTSVVLYI